MEWGQTDYTNLIDESIPHTNDLKTIHVYFTKPGDHTVRLCNTFRRQVVYPYSVYDDNTGGYIKKYCYAKQEGDVYVMDTTFHIRVYDPNLVPAVKVYSDPECTQEMMKEAVRIIDGRAETECSGNVTLENVARLTDIGVDYISSGALTHSAPILDVSLKNLHAV